MRTVNLVSFSELLKHAEGLGYSHKEAMQLLDCVYPNNSIVDFAVSEITVLTQNQKGQHVLRSFLNKHGIGQLTVTGD